MHSAKPVEIQCPEKVSFVMLMLLNARLEMGEADE